MTTQAELLAAHRAGLDAAWHAKWPHGMFVLQTGPGATHVAMVPRRPTSHTLPIGPGFAVALTEEQATYAMRWAVSAPRSGLRPGQFYRIPWVESRQRQRGGWRERRFTTLGALRKAAEQAGVPEAVLARFEEDVAEYRADRHAWLGNGYLRKE